jgi:hypothetical protein
MAAPLHQQREYVEGFRRQGDERSIAKQDSLCDIYAKRAELVAALDSGAHKDTVTELEELFGLLKFSAIPVVRKDEARRRSGIASLRGDGNPITKLSLRQYREC